MIIPVKKLIFVILSWRNRTEAGAAGYVTIYAFEKYFMKKGGKIMADTGVSVDDFQQILADMGRTVSYKVVTRSQDSITGSETTTFAAAVDVTAIFFLNENKYIWDKEGLVAVGDAYLIVPITFGAKRYDQVTIDGESYYVDNTRNRYVLTVGMQTYCTLFKVA